MLQLVPLENRSQNCAPCCRSLAADCLGKVAIPRGQVSGRGAAVGQRVHPLSAGDPDRAATAPTTVRNAFLFHPILRTEEKAQ